MINITERGLQSMMSLAENMLSAGVPASVALSVAMCKYIDLDVVGLEEKSLKKAMTPYLDALVAYMPLNLINIRKFSYQLHQYRHSVKSGAFANGTGVGDTGWLFGMSTYIDETYRAHLNTPETLPLVRKFNSVLAELNQEIIHASNA
jgi:hypothetical protein